MKIYVYVVDGEISKYLVSEVEETTRWEDGKLMIPFMIGLRVFTFYCEIEVINKTYNTLNLQATISKKQPKGVAPESIKASLVNIGFEHSDKLPR